MSQTDRAKHNIATAVTLLCMPGLQFLANRNLIDTGDEGLVEGISLDESKLFAGELRLHGTDGETYILPFDSEAVA